MSNKVSDLALFQKKKDQYLSEKSKGEKDSVVKSDKLSPEETIQKTKQDFLKIISATLKFQNPEKPADAGQIAQTMASIQQTEETVKMQACMQKLEESMRDSKLTRSLPLQDKKVRVHIGTKKFEGKEKVDFSYQIRFDDLKKPPSSTISTIISVYNSRGVKVFESKGNNTKGTHKFTWDGKDSFGRVQDAGEYSLKVDSNFIYKDQSGKEVKVPIESGSFIEGKVEALDFNDGKVQLLVQGNYYDLDDVIKVMSDLQKDEDIKISDYAGYIGQVAEIAENNLQVDEKGFATINYKCEIDRPGNILVQVLHDGVLMGVGISEGVKKGENTLRIKLSDALNEEGAIAFNQGSKEFKPLMAGKYQYKILQQNLLDTNPEKYSEITTSRHVKITGLDFSKEPLVLAGSEKFHVDTIKKLQKSQDTESVLENNAKYIGKVAKVNFSNFEIKRGQSHITQYVELPKLDESTRYTDAEMIVYDSSGKQIARVKTPRIINPIDSKIYYKHNLWSFLKNEDMEKIMEDRAIESPATDIDSIERYYREVVNPRLGKDAFEEFIEEIVTGVFSGQFQLDDKKIAAEIGYNPDELTEIESMFIKQAKRTNSRVTGFYWDLKDSTGKLVPPGNYKYEIMVEKKVMAGRGGHEVLELEKVNHLESVKISEYRAEKGEVKYYGHVVDQDGSAISDRLIDFAYEEIVGISA